jgi:hypothetical protein
VTRSTAPRTGVERVTIELGRTQIFANGADRDGIPEIHDELLILRAFL